MTPSGKRTYQPETHPVLWPQSSGALGVLCSPCFSSSIAIFVPFSFFFQDSHRKEFKAERFLPPSSDTNLGRSAGGLRASPTKPCSPRRRWWKSSYRRFAPLRSSQTRSSVPHDALRSSSARSRCLFSTGKGGKRQELPPRVGTAARV